MENALFHRIIDTESARVRNWLVSHGFKEKINFRNVDISESALAKLKELTGKDIVPCLVYDGQILVGRQAIEQHMSKFI